MPFCSRRCLSGEGDEVKEWLQIRRQRIRALRLQTKHVILLLALREALKQSPMQLVYAGRHGYPEAGKEDFGIVYTFAYLVSYLYICAFMIVYVPFFSWWVPASKKSDSNTPDGSSAKPSTLEKISKWINKFNMIWLPLCAAISAVTYVLHLIEALVYVDERRTKILQMPQNTRRAWAIRAGLLASIAWAQCFGCLVVNVLEQCDLGHVKTFEYYAIIVPVMTNLGMVIGTKMQNRMEKRAARRAAAKIANIEAQVVDEKVALMSGM